MDSVVRNYIVVKNTTDRLPHSEIPNWFRQARVDASGPRDVFIRITLRWSECWPAVWLIIAGAGNESLHMLGVLSCQCACVRVPGAVTSASRRRDGGGLCEECDWFSCSHGSIVVAESLSVCNWFSIELLRLVECDAQEPVVWRTKALDTSLKAVLDTWRSTQWI